MNVNFPDVVANSVRGICAARQGKHKIGDDLHENRDPRGVPYYWIGAMRKEDADQQIDDGGDQQESDDEPGNVGEGLRHPPYAFTPSISSHSAPNCCL